MSTHSTRLNILVYGSPDKTFEQSLPVYAQSQLNIAGHTFRVKVIGWSHFICCENLSYFECVSCIPIPRESCATIDITTPHKRHLIKVPETRGYAANITYFVTKKEQPLEGVPIVEFVFPNGGTTGVNATKNGYATIHTYPEFGTYAYTRTTFVFQ